MLQIFSLPLKTVPSQQGGGQLDDDQDKEVHVHVSSEIFHVQTQSKVHKCVNKPRKKTINEINQRTTKVIQQAWRSLRSKGIIAPWLPATHQFKQQIMIRFLSFGVLIKSNVPYLRVSSLLTSAFLTSEITCFRCLESTSTPFLAAYFMSRLWASSRRLLARSHRGDSGIHLREIKKQLLLNEVTLRVHILANMPTMKTMKTFRLADTTCLKRTLIRVPRVSALYRFDHSCLHFGALDGIIELSSD